VSTTLAPASPLAAPAGTHPGGRAGRRPRRGPVTGPVAGAAATPVDPAALAHGFARLFLEVESGRRPAAQLEPLVDRVLYARLATVWVRPGPVPQLRGVFAAPAAPGCYEAVALVRRGDRCAAVALRLRRTPHGWRVDAVARPEDGPLPPPAWEVVPDDAGADDEPDGVGVDEPSFPARQ
jgi:hypothetical protein